MEKNCKTCNAKFKTRKDRPGKFCSLECHNEHKRQKSKYPFKRECEYCSESFTVHNFRQKNKKFCNNSCAAKSSNSGRTGTKYKQNTNRNSFRRGLIKLYGHACMVCGYNKFVEAHHIHERGNGGKDMLDNGVLLCPNCHTEVHGGLLSDEELWKVKKEFSS